jgi:hypothetical protein
VILACGCPCPNTVPGQTAPRGNRSRREPYPAPRDLVDVRREGPPPAGRIAEAPEQARLALSLIGKDLTVKGFFLGHFDHMSKILPAQIEAAPLVASGAPCVPVAAVYPMSKIKEAVAHLLKGSKTIDVASTSNG